MNPTLLPSLTGTISFFLIVTIICNSLFVRPNLLNESWDRLQVEIDPKKISIEKLNSTSVILRTKPVNNIHNQNNNSSQYVNETLQKATYSVTYKLNHLFVKALESSYECFQQQYPFNDPVGDVDVCKAQVHNFEHDNNNSSSYKENHPYEYCQEHTVSLGASNGTNSVVITNLLPLQQYIFQYEITLDGRTIIPRNMTSAECVNMDESVPLYPPQTDLGSFRVILPPKEDVKKDKSVGLVRIIELYWRHLPQILQTSVDLNYTMDAINLSSPNKSPIFNRTFDLHVGKTKIDVPLLNNNSYKFIFRSQNHIGVSERFSEIFLPTQDDVIDISEGFHFYVIAVNNFDYLLKWTDVRELLSSTEQGTYTIYWCPMASPTGGCTTIDGIIRTNFTEFGLDIPGRGLPQPRIFGISYRDSKNFTGISWAECVAATSSQDQAVSDPLILKADSVANNHTAITVNWAVRGCRSIAAAITLYEINYCNIGTVDPCADPTSLSKSDHFDYDFDDGANCKTENLPNLLVNEFTLTNLNASTKYAIRIRQVIHKKVHHEQSHNRWSTAEMAQTSADPAKTEKCIRYRAAIIVVIILACTIAAGAIVYFPAQRIFLHYWQLIFKYRRTNTGLSQRFVNGKQSKGDDLSELGLKYWINRFPSSTSGSTTGSEFTLNSYSLKARNGADGENVDDYDDQEKAAELMDYLPSQALTTNHAEQSMPDNISDNSCENFKDASLDADGASIASHSSFLENILNNDEDTVLNNRPNSITESAM